MILKCVNLVTTDVAAMRDFYAMALQVEWDESHGGPDRCEILTQGAVLVLCRTNTPVAVHPDSCGLEFQVEDVDAEHSRLQAAGVAGLTPPVTYPWGSRAISFRDPDGNNIDFVQQL